jgi:hypothetical protein
VDPAALVPIRVRASIGEDVVATLKVRGWLQRTAIVESGDGCVDDDADRFPAKPRNDPFQRTIRRCR